MIWEIWPGWGRRTQMAWYSGLRWPDEGWIYRKVGRAAGRNDFSNTLRNPSWYEPFKILRTACQCLRGGLWVKRPEHVVLQSAWIPLCHIPVFHHFYIFVDFYQQKGVYWMPERVWKTLFGRCPLKSMIYSTLSGRFVPDEWLVTGCADQTWRKYHAKRGCRWPKWFFTHAPGHAIRRLKHASGQYCGRTETSSAGAYNFLFCLQNINRK